MQALSTTYLPVSEGELIKTALGASWGALHPNIQRRFDHNPTATEQLYYQGTLDNLWCSTAGRWLARFTSPLLGGVLIPACQQHVPVDIVVFSKPDDKRIYKRRWYHLAKSSPIIFTSHMALGEDNVLLEYVGAGFGMGLKLSVVEGDLHFHSCGYFWEIFGVKIPLPNILTPGATWLIHHNVSAQEFAIKIVITHRWFGRTFLQEGRFHSTDKSFNLA